MTSVVLRCDGSAELGLGHVVRCLAIGDELSELGARVVFAMTPDQLATQLVTRAGHAVAGPDAVDGADVALFDLRDGGGRAELDRLRAAGTVVGVLDDGSDRRLAADVVFYPPVPRVARFDWDGFDGVVHSGFDWVALRRVFAAPPPRVSHETPRVLVAAGGSDPAGLTLRVVEALERIARPLAPVLLLGAGFAKHAELAALLDTPRHACEVHADPQDVVAVMASADAAVASFGVTAYELAALRVPALYLCLTDDHADSALALVAAGAARSLGRHDLISDDELAASVQDLLAAPFQVPPLVDGLGARRIAGELLTLAQRPRSARPERTAA